MEENHKSKTNMNFGQLYLAECGSTVDGYSDN